MLHNIKFLLFFTHILTVPQHEVFVHAITPDKNVLLSTDTNAPTIPSTTFSGLLLHPFFFTLFWGAPKSLQMVIATMKLKDVTWKESYDQPRQHIQKQRHYFTNKVPSCQGYGFSSGHVGCES